MDWNHIGSDINNTDYRHHLRGGVDWNCGSFTFKVKSGASPPAWWCGLKLLLYQMIGNPVWSPPAWWCGLKFIILHCFFRPLQSPPAWWCGLNFFSIQIVRLVFAVTTCVVVWIEIDNLDGVFFDCWCHHLRGGVDWNLTQDKISSLQAGHHLRGGVDWNTPMDFIITDCDNVTTCVVVWIEISPFLLSYHLNTVTTCVVVWIEIWCRNYSSAWGMVTTCVVVWIEIFVLCPGGGL